MAPFGEGAKLALGIHNLANLLFCVKVIAVTGLGEGHLPHNRVKVRDGVVRDDAIVA